MLLNEDQCYRALVTHDARFDGRFFVGVRTTRIYCRPVCTARTPLRRNCRFYPSAAAAEAEGFRPCLRCRPELAPGHAAVDASSRLAQAAAGLIEDGRLIDSGLDDLARSLGITDRHLRRVFQQEFGVAPVEYAQTQRLLLAKRLLTDTNLPVIDVAMASGFASLRRFNDLFQGRYRMTPTSLRRGAIARTPGERLVFGLAYRPPYDWDAMLDFLARRAIDGVEAVVRGKYWRTVRVPAKSGEALGWICAERAPRRSSLRVTASPSLAHALPALLSRVKHLFDLGCRPEDIARALGELAESRPGLRVPGSIDGFETAVRAIIGQQVTVKAATRICARFAAAFGEKIETPNAALTTVFPSARAIAALEPAQVAAQGIVLARSRAICALAREVVAGRLRLDPSADIDRTLEKLQQLPGIGPWTAHYVAMRALGWPDAFPPGDVAVLKALRQLHGTDLAPRAAEARAEAWQPWRAYAVLRLWNSL